MVLLEDIIKRQQSFSNLSTSLPVLDSYIFNTHIRNKVYDFQSTPANKGIYHILIQLILSHLKNDSNHKIIIIDCLNKFPAQLLSSHPDFNHSYQFRIHHYRIDTFAKLYYFFINNDIPRDSMVILHEFHSVLELYKLEMSATYEELILKHHIEQNSVIIENSNRNDKLPIPQLPKNSHLIKMSPISKYETHVNNLITLMNKICLNSNVMIYLIGYLNTKYRPYMIKPKSSEQSSMSSSQITQSEKGRVILSPFQVHKSLSMKCIFYKDWYFKTPNFKQDLKSDYITRLTKEDLKFIFAVQIESNAMNYSPVLYFDINNDHSLQDLSKVPDLINLPSSPIIQDTSYINVSTISEEVIQDSEEEDDLG